MNIALQQVNFGYVDYSEDEYCTDNTFGNNFNKIYNEMLLSQKYTLCITNIINESPTLKNISFT